MYFVAHLATPYVSFVKFLKAGDLFPLWSYLSWGLNSNITSHRRIQQDTYNEYFYLKHVHSVYSQDTIFLNGAVIWHYICLILFYNPSKIITGEDSKRLHSTYHKPGIALLFLFLHPSTLPVHVCADVYVCMLYAYINSFKSYNKSLA